MSAAAPGAGAAVEPGAPGAPGAGPGDPGTVVEPGPLVEWYRRCARDLPWRRPGTGPYAVLVCEVMSQQTPVARVEPVWREWMRRWPDPAALAGAPTAQVLRVWGRLGYPRRALRLIEAARAVVAEHGGTLPEGYEELLALPGVGPYTAGAVRAFAYGRRALALDTNARRVLARAVGGTALPPPNLGRAERERAEALLPPDDAGAALWSAAVMELGALVCTAGDPRCGECPWRGRCAWVAAGRPPDEHAARRRRQAWRGTDRQARGLVMARLRETGPGQRVGREELLAAAAAGTPADAAAGASATVSDRAGDPADPRRPERAAPPRSERSSSTADPRRPERILAGLLADGLMATDDGGATYRLP